MSTLKERWQKVALENKGKKEEAEFWKDYLEKEQKIYEDILAKKNTSLKGKLSDLALKYNMSNEYFFGFLDGIRGAFTQKLDIDSLEDNTQLDYTIDFEKLYKEMVEYKADHLYKLPQWNDIFDEIKRKELYIEQKKSKTVINPKKIGRNDPCPCGSGKKYKRCCGMNE